MASLCASIPDLLILTCFFLASFQSGLILTCPDASNFERVFVIAPFVTLKLLANCIGVFSFLLEDK